MNTNVCVPGPDGVPDASAALAQLHLYRPTEPTTAVGGDGSSDLSRLAKFYAQVDWKATLEGTNAVKDVSEGLLGVAKRVAGLKAFRRKYFRLIFDEVRRNRAGGLAGIVVSKKWHGYVKTLKNIGEPLERVAAGLSFLDLGVKMHDLDWHDLSARGIGGNVLAGTAQWAYESVALGPAKTAREVSGWIGDGAGRLGYKETARDFEQFGRDLEGTINSAKGVIDRTMSAANAQDVLTWDRTVFNPDNWKPVFEEAGIGLHRLRTKTVHLFDAVVDAHASGGASGAW